MEDNNGLSKSVFYSILAACIFGIIIIGALVMKSDTSQGFSELYFEDINELPEIVDLGKEVNFKFKVVSHEKEEMSYKYKATYDDKLINSSTFILKPEELKLVSVEFYPKNSTLTRIATPRISTRNLTGNAQMAAIASMDANTGRTEIITSQNGYSAISWNGNDSHQVDVVQPGRIIIPMDNSIGGLQDQMSLIILNPLSREDVIQNCSILSPIGDLNELSPSNSTISNLGYNLKQIQWKLKNDHGQIDIRQRTIDADYLYAFKKVSVEVLSQAPSPQGQDTEYEIHFWVIVTEEPEPYEMIPL